MHRCCLITQILSIELAGGYLDVKDVVAGKQHSVLFAKPDTLQCWNVTVDVNAMA